MYSKKNRILCYAFTLLPFFVGLILWGTAREAAFPCLSGTDPDPVPVPDGTAGKGSGEKQEDQQRCHLDDPSAVQCDLLD